MSEYKHLLVALDVLSECTPIVDRAVSIASENTTLSLIYVVEPIFIATDYVGTAPLDIQDDSRGRAIAALKLLGEEHRIPDERQIVDMGRPPQVIHEYAIKLDIDLIVMGSHGRHGAQLLLGSTANAVLHGATCDVLAVRLGKIKGK